LNFKSAVEGAVALEFAIVAPAFLLLLLFPISLGYTMILKQGLDYATGQVAEQIATGQVQAAQLNQANFITTIVCPRLPSIFSCSNVIVNVQNVPTNDASFPSEYYAFVNTAKTALIPPPSSNANASYCIGNAQSYVYLQILYPIPSLFSLLPGSPGMTSYNGQMVYMVTSTATFLNEPFVAPPVAC
jgi:Flp pilus assembly protein TadG